MGFVLYNLKQLRDDREIWKNLDFIPILCSYCGKEFETRYGTLYNVIRRNAEGIYCNRKCAGSARALLTQNKYKNAGGKICKRCSEFKNLDEFSTLPSPPYFRAECRRCHNYKPARQYSLIKDKASRFGILFSLSLDEFLEFWNADCFYCGSEIKTARLDVCDKELGYIVGNVISCCKRCQKFKNNLDHFEFIETCIKISLNMKGERNE